MIHKLILITLVFLYFSNKVFAQWEPINNNLLEYSVIDVVEYENKLFLLQNNGVYSSNDSGRSWNIFHKTNKFTKIKVLDDDLYIASEDSYFNNNLLKYNKKNSNYDTIYKDYGMIKDFTKLNNFFIITTFCSPCIELRTKVIYSFDKLKTWFFNRYSDNIYFTEAHDSTIYTSNLGWIVPDSLNKKLNKRNYATIVDNINCIEFDNDDYYVGGTKGLFKFSNNATVSKLLAFSGEDISEVILDSKLFVCATPSGFFSSINKGKVWDEKNVGLYNRSNLKHLITKSKLHIVNNIHSGVFVSTNEGDNWIESNKGLQANDLLQILSFNKCLNNFYCFNNNNCLFKYDSINNYWLNLKIDLAKPTKLLSNDSLLFLLANSKLYMSRDSGSKWEQIYSKIPIIDFYVKSNNIALCSKDAYCLLTINSDFSIKIQEFSKSWDLSKEYVKSIQLDNNKIVLLTSKTIYKSDLNLYPLFDISKNLNLIYEKRDFRYLKILNEDNYELSNYASIFKTTNNGVSWNDTLIQEGAKLDDFQYYNGNYYFISYSRLYISKDSMKTWSEVNSPKIQDIANVLSINFIDNYLYVLTSNLGIYRAKLENLSNIENETMEEYIKVYPNPCNDILSIDLDHEQTKLIEIYDLQANLVFQQSLNQYESKIDLDISSLSKSVYFLKINNKIRSIIKE